MVPLHTSLRSSLNDRRVAVKIGTINRFSGFTAGHQRWRWMSAALWLKWRSPVDSWMLGDGVWRVRLGRGLLEKEIAAGWIFWQRNG